MSRSLELRSVTVCISLSVVVVAVRFGFFFVLSYLFCVVFSCHFHE